MMERQQGGSSAVLTRLFSEESGRDLLPGAVHGPLRQAAQEFFISAIPTSEDESRNGSRIRQTIAANFYQRLNSDFSDNLGGGVLELSQPETNYGVLLMKLASTPSGPARDGLLRDITLARVKLVTKEERAPLTRGLRELIQKAGWQRATGLLQPGSDEKRLQTVEGIILQKLGHQDLRMLFEAKEEIPQQVLEKFMGKSTQAEDEPVGALPEEEEQIKRTFGDQILKWFKNINWKFVGKGSAAMLGGIWLGELLKFSLFTESLMGSVLVGVNLLLRKVRGAEKVEAFIKSREEKYPHASERLLNRVVMATAMGELRAVKNALRVVESPEAMFVGLGISIDAGARSVIAAVGARQLLETKPAGPGEVSGGATGDLPPAPTEVSAGGGSTTDVLSQTGQDFLDKLGHPELVEAQERMAAEAAGDAAQAAQQAAIEAAQAPLEMLGRDLAGGDVWSQAMKTAGELGVHHVTPVANLIKNLDYAFEQAQSFRHIGPEDVVNLVDPKLAAWAGQELDKIVGMDPSTLTGYKRLLWDIGVSARHAVPADLEELSKAFVEAAAP